MASNTKRNYSAKLSFVLTLTFKLTLGRSDWNDGTRISLSGLNPEYGNTVNVNLIIPTMLNQVQNSTMHLFLNYI